MKQRDKNGRFASGCEYTIDAAAGVVRGRWGEPMTCIGSFGYVLVGHGKKGNLLAHRLIWESVHGPIPKGMTINHINGVKTDNRLENLELLSVADNMKHAYRTGLIDKKGEAHAMHKLTEESVLFIRKNRGRYSNRQFAEMFGVGIVCVSQAANGHRWKHLPMASSDEVGGE